MAGWDKRGSTRRWRKVRAAVLARDRYVCQIAGPRCTTRATTVDHLDALAFGGSLLPDPSRLRAACVACNSGEGARMRGRAARLGPASREWGV